MYSQMNGKTRCREWLLCFMVLVALSWFAPQHALAANEMVGKIFALTGTVGIEREGKTWQLQIGEDIRLHDRLQTGIDSRAEILFIDESRIRMAPNTSLEITEYLYQPEKKKRKGLLSLWAGKARFIVNDLVGFAQKDFEVRTQAGTAGTRGTDFVVELRARESEKIGALGKHRFDLQQEIERFVKQHKFSSGLVYAQFSLNYFSHKGPLLFASREDISREKANTSTTMKLAQGDEETEGVVTVIEGEVFVCPVDEAGNIILEECVTVRGGEYVVYGIGFTGEVTEIPADFSPEEFTLVEPGPIPEDLPPLGLPGEEPYERVQDTHSP